LNLRQRRSRAGDHDGGCGPKRSSLSKRLIRIPFFVMAGLIPAMHVFLA